MSLKLPFTVLRCCGEPLYKSRIPDADLERPAYRQSTWTDLVFEFNKDFEFPSYKLLEERKRDWHLCLSSRNLDLIFLFQDTYNWHTYTRMWRCCEKSLITSNNQAFAPIIVWEPYRISSFYLVRYSLALIHTWQPKQSDYAMEIVDSLSSSSPCKSSG